MRLLSLLFLVLYFVPASAQNIPDSLNVISGPGHRIKSPNFTGPVWADRMVIIEDENHPEPIGNVTAAHDTGLTVPKLGAVMVHF